MGTDSDVPVTHPNAELFEEIRRRLLDQTRRSQLLNYKERGIDVPVVDELPDQVFDQLVSNLKNFGFDFRRVEEGQEDIGHTEISRVLPTLDDQGSETPNRYRDLKLQTPFVKKDLESRLVRLYRRKNTILGETGCANLYAAIHFLEWKVEGSDAESQRAPLFLIPVELDRKAGQSINRYSLRFSDTAIASNYALLKKIENDFDIVLPEIEEGQTPDSYAQKIQEGLNRANNPNLSIRRQMVVGLFPFAKEVIWNDLDSENWADRSQLLDHPIATRVLTGLGDGSGSGPGLLSDEYDQETELDGNAANSLKLVLDADSSQYSAITDALKTERALVIEGPPGTGKSQTITNLIACALAEGKSVLFVCEKMAALEVVSANLKKVGLGRFCFEAHSTKTSKVELLRELGSRIEFRPPPAPNHKAAHAAHHEARTHLNAHSSAASQSAGPHGEAIYSSVWEWEKLRQKRPSHINEIGSYDLAECDSERIYESRQLLQSIGINWESIPAEARAAWNGWSLSEYRDTQSTALENLLRSLIETLDGMDERLSVWLSRGLPETVSQFENLRGMAGAIPSQWIPEYPIDADYFLVKKIISGRRTKDAVDLLRKIESFFEAAKKAESLQAVGNAAFFRSLHETTPRLVADVCKSDQSWLGLSDLASKIGSVRNAIDRGAQTIEKLSDLLRIPNPNLSEALELGEQAKGLVGEFPNASRFAHEGHVREEANSALLEAQRECDEILARESALQIFRDVRSQVAADIRPLLQILNREADSFLPFLRADFRDARQKLMKILKNPAAFSRSGELLQKFDALACYCEDRDAFQLSPSWQASLGPGFSGLETDWGNLKIAFEVAARLKSNLGPRAARKILSDWGASVDEIEDFADELSVVRASIEDLVQDVAIAESYWRRSPDQVLESLADSQALISDAVEKIVPQLRSDAKLDETPEVVESYSAALRIESEIRRSVAFDELLGEAWRGCETEISQLKSSIAWIQRCLESPGSSEEILDYFFSSDVGVKRSEFDEFVSSLGPDVAAVDEVLEELLGFGSFDEKVWFARQGETVKSIQARMRTCRGCTPHLPALAQIDRSQSSVQKLGLEEYVNALKSGTVSGSQIADVFHFEAYGDHLHACVSANPILGSFANASFENIQETFREKDCEVLVLNGREVARKVCERKAPEGRAGARVSAYTEMHLIRREATKKRAHIPTRELLSRAGRAVQSLKPCFLMSPLSVAQFLPRGDLKFDLVIMDEASQIRPEDALGAIVRSDRAVVVGDPKQLPPTSFFEAGLQNISPEEQTQLDDTESILELCLRQFPYRRLRWHYRSKHESLIHFSNVRFYDGDLIVFPSAQGKGGHVGVHYNYVSAPSYRSGRNRAEVGRVVEIAVKQLLAAPEKSLGIVAFNRRQTDEIEQFLENERLKRPELNQIISAFDPKDSLFVKNLENVQGDERDVIIISTVYGPEKEGGVVAQRFGPIASEKGWRRLNVVVTRARERVEVVTSLRPQDIRSDGSTPRGTKELREYLHYAETKQISEAALPTGEGPDNAFEEAVGKFVSDAGFEWDAQVGVSGFFIDIGVKNPLKTGEYILGIECDGAPYHSSRSARDRDRIRQQVLEEKGWKFHRIWSTSWFNQRSAEIERLNKALEAASQAEQEKQTELDAVAAETTGHEVGIEDTEPSQQGLFEETEDQLARVLERFWHENIQHEFSDRDKSILSEHMVKILVEKKPESEDAWFRAVPQALRLQIDSKERNRFLHDVLEEISMYA